MKPESMARLLSLGKAQDEAGRRMAEMRGRFAELAARHENGTAPVAVSSFNLFQTPEHIAARMAALVAARVGDCPRILEPSAGLGRIYRAISAALPASRIVIVEESADCCRELYRLTDGREGDRLFQRDFLAMDHNELGGTVDAVCMNPPFKQGADIRHIRHAMAMLKPGGLLVSLCYAGARQSAALQPMAETWERLPSGSFRESGTNAEVMIMTATKGDNTP